MAISVIQQTTVTQGGAGEWNNTSSITVTFGSPTTTGNAIIVYVSEWNGAVPTITVTDNKSNSFPSVITALGTSNTFSGIYCCQNITGGSSHQITATNTGGNPTASTGAIWAIEVSGLLTSLAVDQTGTNNADIGAAATSYAVSTATLSQAAEFAVAGGVAFANNHTLANPASPWTAGFLLNSSNTEDNAAVYQTVNATTALTSTWTFTAPGSASPASAVIATFKANPGGPTSADCSFHYQPSALLNHPATLDTNQLHRYDVAPPETKVGSPQLDTGPYNPGTLGSGVLGALVPSAVASNPTPADCSMLFQASANLVHPRTLDTNQPLNDTLAGRPGATPTQLAFWFQPPFLGPTPKSTQNTNQPFDISPKEPKTPTAFWWIQPVDLQRHVPTIYTAQSFLCNPTIGPPVPGWFTQAPDLLNHPHSLDTNQRAPTFIAPAAPVPSNQVNEYWAFASIGHLAIGQGTLPAGTPTPTDCSFLFEPSALLNHPQTLDTNQPKDNFFAGWANTTPAAFGFWTQASNLLRHATTLDTNQPLDQGWIQNLTPVSLAFWKQADSLLKHPNTLDTNQAFDAGFAGQTNVTPAQLGFWTQAPDLLRHPSTVNTHQPFNSGFAGQANVTPATLGFWTQPQDLLRHPNTVDTRQQFEFAPPAQGATPSQLGFFAQAPDLLRHPSTVDTNQKPAFLVAPAPTVPSNAVHDYWLFAPVGHFTIGEGTLPTSLTPTDCSFLFQPSALLKHPATVDTNQPLNDAFSGRAGATPSALGFWTQALDLFKHPVTLDTNQQRVSYQDKATPTAFGFWLQAPNLLKHPSTVDTNLPFDDAFVGWAVLTPAQLGFWQQPPDLLRHAVTLDTNQPRDNMFSGWANATPTSFGFFTQAPALLRHASTIDTNQAFVFNPPAPAVTPSAYWWFQPPDLLKHPATVNTLQSFKFLPPPQPPFGWLVQPQVLLRHPVPFILGGQYSFVVLPTRPTGNAIIKVYFFN